jgi:ferredoxin
MALEIIESCVNCWACKPLCPNKAIVEARPPEFAHFMIDAENCTECQGDYAEAQCVAICPIEGAIIDELGIAMNPPGSLTGIPPERWAEAQAEIGAR